MGAPVLQRGDILRIRDERWTVARQVRYPDAAVVDVLGCGPGNRGARASFLLPFEPFERLPRAMSPRVVRRRRWQRLARHLLADAVPSFAALRVLARAKMELLPFQLEPALAVAHGRAARLLIADEVGLGKTVQAGLVVAETLERDARARALVVTPASLREQWKGELAARFGLNAAVLDAAAVAQPGGRAAGGENPWAVPLVITSIDYLKRPEVLRALEALVWDVVVIDEAHHASGWSDRHTAAAAIGERTRTLVLLTATPHGGDEEAFARLCAIGDIDGQFPLAVFRRTRQHIRKDATRRAVWLRVAPTGLELEMHRALADYARGVWRHASASPGPTPAAARLAMVVLVKRACSSAASLARSVERRIALIGGGGHLDVQLRLPLAPLEGDDEPCGELGAPGLPDVSDECRRLQMLLDLARRAQARESKLSALTRLLRRTREPAIVFTEYRDTLTDVAGALAGQRIAQLHGGLSAFERHDVLRQFTQGEADVLLATDAAGEGLNLQHRCRLVVNLELPWTPTKLEQRVGRVDRIGQTRRVHQVHLVAAGTTEEMHVAPIVHRRRARVERTLDAMRLDDAFRAEVSAAAELAIAATALDAPPLPASANPPPDPPALALPEGLFVISLKTEAEAEAERASGSRALAAAGRGGEEGGRLVVTARGRRISRACWAFRQEFTDDEGEIVWETVFGIAHEVQGTFARAAAVRQCVDRARRALAVILDAQQTARHAELQTATGTQLALAIARERGIASGLERRRARLAAALVQRELFGRRSERETSAQRDVVVQALRRCDEQVARLERRRRLAGSTEPALAIFLP